VRRNGSLELPSNDVPSIENGELLSSLISNKEINIRYNIPIGNKSSFRFKCRINDVTPASGRYFLDWRAGDSGLSSYFTFQSPGTIAVTNFSPFNVYVNAVETTDVSSLEGEWIDVVITGTNNQRLTLASLGRWGLGSGNSEIDFDFVEIYNKALTQEEVTNLYNSSRYIVPNLNKGIQYGGDLHNFPTGYVTAGDASIDNEIITLSPSSPNYVYKVYGQFDTRYYIKFKAKSTVAGDELRAYMGANEDEVVHTMTTEYKDYWGIHYDDSANAMYLQGLSGTGTISIKEVTFHLITIEPTQEILWVNSFSGVARNVLSGDVTDKDFMDTGKGTFEDGTVETWAAYGANTIENENNALKTTYVDTGGGSRVYLRGSSDLNRDLVIGSKYKVSILAKKNQGIGILRINDSSDLDQISIAGTEYTWHYLYFTAISTASATIRMLSLAAGDIVWIDRWYLEEIIPPVVNTDVTVVREGEQYVPRSNKDTTKVDCGDYHDLTGDITVLAWIRPNSLGENNSGTIIENAQFRLHMLSLTGNLAFRVTSNGGGDYMYGTVEVNPREYALVAVIRPSGGVADMYINGEVDVTDDDTGTPVAGTTNIILFNRSAYTTCFDGDIAEVKVIEGLLTAEEISQYFSATKHKYNK